MKTPPDAACVVDSVGGEKQLKMVIPQQTIAHIHNF